MRYFKIVATTLAALISVTSAQSQVKGFDVSEAQPNINWQKARADGAAFAIIRATDGLGNRSPSFNAQFNSARAVGLIRGAYHVARLDISPGSVQASFFLSSGGGWVADGQTLPGTLKLETRSGSNPCYGLPPLAVINWIMEFSSVYRGRTGRFPTIQTTTNWWNQCTGGNPMIGGSGRFALFLTNWAGAPGPIPIGWRSYQFWQSAGQGIFPGNQDTWNGDINALRAFAIRG